MLLGLGVLTRDVLACDALGCDVFLCDGCVGASVGDPSGHTQTCHEHEGAQSFSHRHQD